MNEKTPPIDSDSMDGFLDDASQKLNIEINALRDVTVDDILYLLDRCPYLQMIDMGPNSNFSDDPRIVTAESGWPIHDYGDAMSSSLGPLLFANGYFGMGRDLFGEEGDDGDGDPLLNPGKGTLYKQLFDTAGQMVQIAQANHWSGIQLVDGHPRMMRAAWAHALQSGVALQGYEATGEDYGMYDRLQWSDSKVEKLRQQLRVK